jgi:hypothetical protein
MKLLVFFYKDRDFIFIVSGDFEHRGKGAISYKLKFNDRQPGKPYTIYSKTWYSGVRSFEDT